MTRRTPAIDNAQTVHVSHLGDAYATFSAYSLNFGGDLEKARAAAVRAAHEHVFSIGKTASVDTGLLGRHGGAYIDGVIATVRVLG